MNIFFIVSDISFIKKVYDQIFNGSNPNFFNPVEFRFKNVPQLGIFDSTQFQPKQFNSAEIATQNI